MQEKIDIQEIIFNLQTKLKDVKDKDEVKSIIQKFLEDECIELKDEIDTKTALKPILDDIMLILSTREQSEDDNVEEILVNTLTLCPFIFESQLALESLAELAKYGKILNTEEYEINYTIYQMLDIMIKYKELIEELDKLENESIHKRGIAKTTYEDVQEAIKPNVNHYEKAYEINDIEENKIAKNIANSFKENPYETNFALESTNIDLMKNITESEKQTFNNQRVFYNSAETLENTHLYKSCQIAVIYMFKKSPKFGILKAPTNEKLANCINNIFNEYFDMYTSNINRNHISKRIQIKTKFKGFDIFEFSTPKNIKKHPFIK